MSFIENFSCGGPEALPASNDGGDLNL